MKYELGLAARVKQARENMGLSQQEAADLCGVSLAEFQQLESQLFVEGTKFTINSAALSIFAQSVTE